MASLLSSLLLYTTVLLSKSLVLACPTNCKACNSTKCSICESSYFLSNSNCSPCPPNCQNCTNYTTCLSCSPAYFLSSFDDLCISDVCNPISCASCNNGTLCSTCQTGYTLNGIACTASTDQQKQSSWIWIISICLACFLLLMALLFCCRKKNISAQAEEGAGQIQSAIHIMQVGGRGNEDNGTDSIRVQVGRRVPVVWEIYLGTHNRQENCPICLEDNTTCISFCMHRFHEECLLAWMAKDRKCPICREKHMHPISYFCLGCFDQCFTGEKNRILQRTNQEQRCDQCQLTNL